MATFFCLFLVFVVFFFLIVLRTNVSVLYWLIFLYQNNNLNVSDSSHWSKYFSSNESMLYETFIQLHWWVNLWKRWARIKDVCIQSKCLFVVEKMNFRSSFEWRSMKGEKKNNNRINLRWFLCRTNLINDD